MLLSHIIAGQRYSLEPISNNGGADPPDPTIVAATGRHIRQCQQAPVPAAGNGTLWFALQRAPSADLTA